jgi:hypothetical protein
MAGQSPAVQLTTLRRETPLPPGAPFYKHLWRGWQRVARAFGNLLSRVVTTFVYFVFVPWFALASRGTTDPLALTPREPRWTSPPPPPNDLEDARRGF